MLEILAVNPPLCSHRDFVMLESFTVTMTVRYFDSIKHLKPQVWTNAINKTNPSGRWHAIDMYLSKTESDGQTHHFRSTFILTGQGHYEFMPRIGFRKNRQTEKLTSGGKSEEEELQEEIEASFAEDDDDIECWKWAGGFGDNGRIKVHPPSERMPWTKGPQAAQIAPNVFIGNFIAASHARELGFSAILNMAKELEMFYPDEDNIEYKKLGALDGAHNPIDISFIEEGVKWIEDKVENGHKVLVHCRAGIGRSGSIGIAYLYSKNSQWSFKDTLKNIWSFKPDIYPHKNLETTLEKLFPRKEIIDTTVTDATLSASTTVM